MWGSRRFGWERVKEEANMSGVDSKTVHRRSQDTVKNFFYGQIILHRLILQE